MTNSSILGKIGVVAVLVALILPDVSHRLLVISSVRGFTRGAFHRLSRLEQIRVEKIALDWHSARELEINITQGNADAQDAIKHFLSLVPFIYCVIDDLVPFENHGSLHLYYLAPFQVFGIKGETLAKVWRACDKDAKLLHAIIALFNISPFHYGPLWQEILGISNQGQFPCVYEWPWTMGLVRQRSCLMRLDFLTDLIQQVLPNWAEECVCHPDHRDGIGYFQRPTECMSSMRHHYNMDSDQFLRERQTYT